MRFLLIAGIAGLSFPGFAFAPHGHEVLESAAYRRVLGMRNIKDGLGKTTTGLEAMRTLFSVGLLESPGCAPQEATTDIRCTPGGDPLPRDFMPPLVTGRLDEVLGRQFSSDGQCFHFMARSADVVETELDGQTGVPTGLRARAYDRCIVTLESILEETFSHTGVSTAGLRGLYAMMHSIADSFSAAHVDRTAEGDIVLLKPWTIRAFIPYALDGSPRDWKYFNGPSHHTMIDPRDEEYVLDTDLTGTIDCRNVAHPNLVPETCLTDRGRAAMNAMSDLLLMVFGVVSAEPGVALARISRTRVAAGWARFVQAHLYMPGAFEPRSTLRGTIVERSPTKEFLFRTGFADFKSQSFGFGYGYSFRGLNILPYELPVEAILSVGQGDLSRIRLELTGLAVKSQIVDVFELGLIGADLTVGDKPSSKESTAGRDVAFDLRLAADAALLLRGNFWLGVHWPFFSWYTGSTHLTDFSLSLILRFGRYDFNAEPTAIDPSWSPPAELDGEYRYRATSLVIAYGAQIPSTATTGTLTSQATLLLDRDHYDRPRGVFGTLLLDFSGSNGEGRVRLGPEIRVRLLSDAFGVALRPLFVEAHFGTGVDPGFSDVGADGAAFLDLGLLEVSLRTPRLTYQTVEQPSWKKGLVTLYMGLNVTQFLHHF